MSVTTTTDRTIMQAENTVHKLFLSFVETIPNAADFFDARSRDLWLREFALWLGREVGRNGASND